MSFLRSQGKSLSHALGGTMAQIASGVSLGIQSDTGKLLDTVAKELADGYQRVTIKHGKDVAFVEAVRKRYPEIDLTVDANSAYRLEDVDLLKQLDDVGLSYIEQPLPWNEIYQHSLLQPQLRTAICLDECIHGLRDAQAAIALGACRVINIKLRRVGDHSTARQIQALFWKRGFSALALAAFAPQKVCAQQLRNLEHPLPLEMSLPRPAPSQHPACLIVCSSSRGKASLATSSRRKVTSSPPPLTSTWSRSMATPPRAWPWQGTRWASWPAMCTTMRVPTTPMRLPSRSHAKYLGSGPELPSRPEVRCKDL